MDNLIVEMEFGSHLYGLSTPSSDTDYKGIYIPTVKDLVFGAKSSIVSSTGGSGKNSSSDVDYEYVSIQKFIKDALSGQTYTIDMLHCSEPMQASSEWYYIVNNRTKFYTKNMKSYIGYVKQQAAKYGIKGSRLSDIACAIMVLDGLKDDATLGDVSDELFLGAYAKFTTIHNKKTDITETYYEVNGKKYQMTNQVSYVLPRLRTMYDSYGERAKLAEKNEGVDWKAISHALRAGYQLKAIYEDGDFKYPLKESEFLLKVKQGLVDFNEVAPVLEQLVGDVERLADESKLPVAPDEEFWYDFVYKLYE